MTLKYLIEWLNDDAAGSFDLIDQSLLEPGKLEEGASHPTDINGSIVESYFDLNWEDSFAVFSYDGKNTATNETSGVSIGKMRIDPSSIAGAITIDWAESGSKIWEPLEVKIHIISEDLQ